MRITAWVLRLKKRLLAKRNQGEENNQVCKGPMAAQELEESRKYLIKDTQKSL